MLWFPVAGRLGLGGRADRLQGDSALWSSVGCPGSAIIVHVSVDEVPVGV